MKSIIALTLSLFLASSASAETSVPDPETWYRDGYAPLWANKPATQVDKMLTYYADTVETHSADGEISRDNKVAWLQAPIEQWLAEGWLQAEMQALKVDRLNASTTVFKARWLDSYKGGATELSCGWYLADFMDGRWQFTTYVDIDCAAHGL